MFPAWSRPLRPWTSLLLCVSLCFAAALGGCTKAAPLVSPASATVPPGLSREPGPMKPIVPSAMVARLEALGLDPAKLPPLERLPKGAVLGVMKTFNEALGVPCTGCHDENNMAADTRRKRVARRMWNEFSRVLATESGAPVYCDSCHQARMFPLDRRDKEKISQYMDDVFVGKLKRRDGKDHECGTCHGDPPEFKFIAQWKEAPAPDLVLASELPQREPVTVAAAPTATAGSATAATAPKPAVAAAPPRPKGECGDKNNPCPLQRWMRVNIAPAVAANDPQVLAKALDRLAAFSPDPSWNWAPIAKAAAAAARRGDMTEARKSCQGCHNAYKEQWKTQFRKRAVQ
jgi:hypothetical protein